MAKMPVLPSTVDTDLNCIKCGYNLYTLPTGGTCPECGSPVWRSRLTRHDLRAYQRFQMAQFLYGSAVFICFCFSWYAQSEIPHTTNGADPRRIEVQEWLTGSAVTSSILIGIGFVWLLGSAYPRRSWFVWVMIGVNVLTGLFSLARGGSIY